MNNEEVIRLVLELIGQEGVERLTQSLGKLRTQVAEVEEGYELLHGENEIVDKDLESFNHIIDVSIAETTKLGAAHKSLGATVKTSGVEISQASTAASRTINQLAYGISDFASVQGTIAQRLNGAVNNIQQMAVTMGASGGVFLAITGLVTLVQLLSTNWESLVSLFAETKTEAAAAEIDKVTEALNKLNEARAKEVSFRKRGEEQSQRADAFHESVGRFGGNEKLVKLLMEAGFQTDLITKMLTQAGSGNGDALEYLTRQLTTGTDNKGKRMATSPLGTFGRDVQRRQNVITNRRDREKADEEEIAADERKNEQLMARRKIAKRQADAKAKVDEKKKEHDDAKRIQENMRLGHAVGKAFDKQENARPDIQPRIPMLQQMDFATGRAMSSVQDTQAALMRQQAQQGARMSAIEQRARNMTQVTLRRGNR